jgi:hypothetical protein
LTLTTHAIVGSAIASLIPTHPLLGICMAFASHFLLDALPHWDYPIRSPSVNPQPAAPMKYDRALLADVATTLARCFAAERRVEFPVPAIPGKGFSERVCGGQRDNRT